MTNENTPATATPEAAGTPAEPPAAVQESTRHNPSAEAAKYRVQLREQQVLNETLKDQLKSSRDWTLSQALATDPAHKPNVGAEAEIAAALDAAALWRHGVLDGASLTQQLDQLKTDRPYLFTEADDREIEYAKKDVRAAHPEIDDDAMRFCPDTDPDGVREWGDAFAAYLAERMGSEPGKGAHVILPFARSGGSNKPDPSTPAGGLYRDPVAAAIMKHRR
ncbi:hypothetical protein [Bifidobacterium subtile]|uniref:hypothetical protein n=1 Tax=Bifidobacterium subtile TaxID=77635 RepID=UPI002F353C8E